MLCMWRQDCPGKATHTVLLACISAADICHEQTLQTLRFAERARSRNLPGAAPTCSQLLADFWQLLLKCDMDEEMFCCERRTGSLSAGCA